MSHLQDAAELLLKIEMARAPDDGEAMEVTQVVVIPAAVPTMMCWAWDQSDYQRAHHFRNPQNDHLGRRLVHKAECVRRIVEYCASRSDLDEIAATVPPLAASNPPADLDVDDAATGFGYVYLMKSGKYHKTGRSVSAERRAYEIQLQLPEELRLVHKTKTDDPVGIEAYWHGRFSDKRVRGEWSELTREDVSVFRRRMFM